MEVYITPVLWHRTTYTLVVVCIGSTSPCRVGTLLDLLLSCGTYAGIFIYPRSLTCCILEKVHLHPVQSFPFCSFPKFQGRFAPRISMFYVQTSTCGRGRSYALAMSWSPACPASFFVDDDETFPSTLSPHNLVPRPHNWSTIAQTAAALHNNPQAGNPSYPSSLQRQLCSRPTTQRQQTRQKAWSSQSLASTALAASDAW